MNPKHLELATQLRRQLHRHPELSMHEAWTKKHLMDFLAQHTSLELVDKGRWFYAIYRAGEDKPSIAFRADFDAVPVQETCDIPWKSEIEGVGHKCGHDGHSASLAAFALVVDKNGADKNIFFLFQHAEETGEGAFECQAFIPEHGISEIFGYHNMAGIEPNTVVTRDGTLNCASKGMSVFFTGHPSHASEPEKGLNPAFAISEMTLAVPGLIDPKKWKGMVLCTVVNIEVGEEAFGVSPGDGVLRMTCRGVFEDEMEALISRLEALARELGEKHCLKVRFEYKDGFPETANHKSSADKIRRAARELGYAQVDLPEPMRGSEDFGYYTKLIPGAMFWIGNPERDIPVHTGDYDFPDSHIERVVAIYQKLAEYPL